MPDLYSRSVPSGEEDNFPSEQRFRSDGEKLHCPNLGLQCPNPNALRTGQVVTDPPFSWIVCPVIQPASFEAR